MTPEYQELINQTFCDNSIRSVMMIDDDFLSYSQCVDAISSGDTLETEAIEKTKRASEITKFFQDRKVLCDIDNNIDVVEIDRIRKCDLLLLDYHLEVDDPTKSLEALRSLRDSKHMNLVVIYTSEPLERVWREVACSLRGRVSNDSLVSQDEKIEEVWLELTQGGAELNPEISSLVSSGQDVASYLLTGKFESSTTQKLAKILRNNTRPLLKRIGEEILAESDLLNEEVDDCSNLPTLQGNCSDNKWLCVGNVFVSFYQKSPAGGSDAEGLWTSLRDSLHNWCPSYYRLITSEIQNHIEDQNLAMKGFLEDDYLGQAAWLWKLITADEGSLSEYEQLCSRVSEGLLDSLLSDKELQSFSKAAIDNAIFPTEIESLTQDTSEDDTPETKAQHEAEKTQTTIKKCATHVSSSIIKSPISNIVHALNQSVSSKIFTGTSLTVGTIIKCQSSGNWYLCVSPACETVPNQLTDNISKRTTPNRILKFLHLKKVKLDIALQNATHGIYLFIRDKDQRVALNVLDNTTALPSIEYGQVLNHDSISICKDNRVSITFTGETEQRTLQVMGQLRDPYSARFQTMASQHEGRVGVDFYPISATKN